MGAKIGATISRDADLRPTSINDYRNNTSATASPANQAVHAAPVNPTAPTVPASPTVQAAPANPFVPAPQTQPANTGVPAQSPPVQAASFEKPMKADEVIPYGVKSAAAPLGKQKQLRISIFGEEDNSQSDGGNVRPLG